MSEVLEVDAAVVEDAMAPLTGAETWLAEKRAEVDAEVARFESFEVTDTDSYKQAKRDRGLINKKVRAINAERIDHVRGFQAALEKFKDDTDSITEPLTAIAEGLDAQCKGWEADVIERRRTMLREAYEDMAPDIALPQDGASAPLVDFEAVCAKFGSGQLGKKWFLYGTSDKVAEQQLVEAVLKIADAEVTINSMVVEEDRSTVKGIYFASLDMDAAMAKARELAEYRERLQALERERAEREAEQRRLDEERERAEREEQERRAREVREAREKAEQDYADGYRTGVLDMPGATGGAVTPEQMHDIERVTQGIDVPNPPSQSVRRELLNSFSGRRRMVFTFDKPLPQTLTLDLSTDEMTLFKRICQYNDIHGTMRIAKEM